MACKCEICDRQTDFFEGIDYGDKCIFHCDKSDEIKWGNPESEDVDRFWKGVSEQIQYNINNGISEYKFEEYIFPIFIHNRQVNNFLLRNPLALTFLGVSFMYKVDIIDAYATKWFFDRSIFHEDIELFSLNIESLHFSDCKFFSSFNLYGIESNELVIEFATLEKSILFVDSNINSFVLSMNKTSKDTYLDFENINFYDFEISGISGDFCGFNIQNIAAKNSFNTSHCNFSKTTFNGLNIDETVSIKIKDSSFLGSHLTNVTWGEIDEERFKIDRQMARQLKSINDAQGETVIANDFYALEMRLRSKELNWREHFGEKLVQNVHGLVSNHSNDWLLPSIWFFVIGLLFVVLAKNIIPVLLVVFVFVLIGASVFLADKIPTKYYKVIASMFLAISVLFYTQSYTSVEYVAALMNPLNIKDSKDLLGDTNLVLVYACRIIEVFIGYQIITAIRKNTRRK